MPTSSLVEQIGQRLRALARRDGAALNPSVRLFVADARGIVRRTIGDEARAGWANDVGLVASRDWSEPCRGANGIGTAIAECTPVVVRGDAHTERQLHALATIGVPVTVPLPGDHTETGRRTLTAVLAAATPMEADDAPTARWLRLAAAALETELDAGADPAIARLVLPADHAARLAEASAHPALVLDSPGRLVHANAAARAVLTASTADRDVRDAHGSRIRPSSDHVDPAFDPMEALGVGWASLAECAAEDRALPTPGDLASPIGPGAHIHAIPIGGSAVHPRLLVWIKRDASTGADQAIPLASGSAATSLTTSSTTSSTTASTTARIRRRPSLDGARHGGNAAPTSEVVGSDSAFLSAQSRAERFGATELPILLTAETGAGKEVLARAIHAASPRAHGPFVPINCGAVAPQLLESELFGYAPGAFTGACAAGSEGKIRAARHGSLFLDEVAEMSPALQSSLLRVLEDGSYYRVGETVPRTADIRIICATWRDLPAMVDAGTFRRDLYYRIKGVRIAIPPLRERTDIQELTNFLLDRLCTEFCLAPARLSREAAQVVRRFAWPGNVRELRSALHQALVLGEGRSILGPDLLPEDIRTAVAQARHGFDSMPDTPAGAGDHLAGAAHPDPARLDELTSAALHHAIAHCHGNMSAAARRLGIARSTLYRQLRRHQSTETSP
ncbi:MAG: sigma-54 interaction domain-containing protein [Phycisphaerales bacterium]